ncbi:chemotaxis protein CheW [Shewanella sp.]|uniref:chemotaxis protein CheW n=1 Tax=Shewanella sp. TaxID=50422 RepID=UPI003561DC01
MSKSVDETVVDFFRLLLSEEAATESVPDKTSAKTQVLQADSSRISKDLSGERAPEKSSPTPLTKPAFSVSRLTEQRTAQVLDSHLADKNSVDKAALEKLLAPVFDEKQVTEAIVSKQVTAPAPVAKAKPVLLPETKPAEKVSPPASEAAQSPPQLQTQTGVTPPSITKDLQAELDDEFQVLFFKVAGLTLAVPLVSLGGIVKVERINQIFGRPDWFLGVQTHRDSQLNLVDTCAWVMPEKYDEELAQNVNYQYLVLLEDSNWGLACESLVNSVRIKQSEVNWRTTAGKRPWLAGVVKEQMCGILNVKALIQMLNAGLGCQDPIN